MIYKPTQFDQQRARLRLEQLIKLNKAFELKAMAESKTPSQNAYFHLLIGWYALELGYTIEYVKQVIVKEVICPQIFVVERTSRKTGEFYNDKRSTVELSVQELTNVINRFRTFASIEHNIYLPEPSDLAAMTEIRIEIDRNKEYL